jgi:hypothetical protein
MRTLLRQFGSDYQVRWGSERRDLEGRFASFFIAGSCHSRSLFQEQLLDFEGLRERLLSSSYAPLPGDPTFEPMMIALRDLFTRLERDGKIAMQYETSIFWGCV